MATHRVTTPKEPVALKLALDTSAVPPQAQSNDVVFVHAKILDREGNPTRVNNAKVKFQVTGDATLLSPNILLSEAGVAVALIKIGDKLDGIQIEAQFKEAKDMLQLYSTDKIYP